MQYKAALKALVFLLISVSENRGIVAIQNSVNICVTIGFLENLTVKTAMLHISFDVKQGVNSAAYRAMNKLFFVVLL